MIVSYELSQSVIDYLRLRGADLRDYVQELGSKVKHLTSPEGRR